MESFGWASEQTIRTEILHTSKTRLYVTEIAPSYSTLLSSREQREHRVFCALLKSIPGLEERLMSASSEEDIQSIAAMVSPSTTQALVAH